MKNIAITGGLLMVWVNGAGRYSIKRLFATFRVPNA
jgi:putative oxidoreductase